tara:strand:+ start:293 stop:634 length:342 start_codon:yes stop_codon:yes gene_type:complete
MTQDKIKELKEIIIEALAKPFTPKYGGVIDESPELIADKWEANVLAPRGNFIPTIGGDVENIVLDNFSWNLSKEGYNYWASIDEKFNQAIVEYNNEALEVTETKETNGNFEVD